MPKSNLLQQSPPYSVITKIKTLGRNLKTARLRRNLTISEVATKIGTGVRAVRDAEAGKPSTSIAVYVALIWLYGFDQDLDDVADPQRDIVGIKLDEQKMPQRARQRNGKMDNDF